MYSTQTSTYPSLCPYLMYSTQTSTHSSLCAYLMYSTQTSTYPSLCPYLMYNMYTNQSQKNTCPTLQQRQFLPPLRYIHTYWTSSTVVTCGKYDSRGQWPPHTQRLLQYMYRNSRVFTAHSGEMVYVCMYRGWCFRQDWELREMSSQLSAWDDRHSHHQHLLRRKSVCVCVCVVHRLVHVYS
jgi:hypothetical protein